MAVLVTLVGLMLLATLPPAYALGASDDAPTAAEPGCVAALDPVSVLERLSDDNGAPHQVPDLERMLPSDVAGRPLATWSVRGADYLRRISGLSEDEILTVVSDLAAVGVDIDDLQTATAGRWDPASDPPYLVTADRIVGVPAASLPRADQVAFPDAGSWSPATIGGPEVMVGEESMLIQDEHLRGRPYIYDVGDVRFVVGTDDEAWAAEAISRLCPPR